MKNIYTNCISLIDTLHFNVTCDCPDFKWDSKENGKYGTILRGQIYNVKVSWSNGNLYIKGSLPKLIKGNNFNNLNLREIDAAIGLLEKELHTDLQSAKITRIDLATNIKLIREVGLYFPLLGRYKTSHRSNIEEASLYFNRPKHSKLLFYDKLKEMRKDKSNKEILKSTIGNYLRFELSCLTKGIKVTLNKELKVADLGQIETNNILAQIWYQAYCDIEKATVSEFEINAGDGEKELVYGFAKIGFDLLGGIPVIDEILKRSSGWKNLRPVYKTRRRKTIKLINNRPSMLKTNNLLYELDNEFAKTYHKLAFQLNTSP